MSHVVVCGLRDDGSWQLGVRLGGAGNLRGWSPGLYSESREAEHLPQTSPPLQYLQLSATSQNTHTHTHTHTLYPLGRHGAEALTRSEADTCQQGPPCLPLAALTMSSSKAAPAEGGGSPSPPPSPQKLFCVISSSECTLLNFSTAFHLTNDGASATSDSESGAIVTATELVLCLQPGGPGTLTAEQSAP